MFKQTRSYKESLYKRLRSNDEASEYLRVALEEGIAPFLTALRNVAESRQIASVAEASSLNREHLYRTLSADGNPKLSSLTKILRSLGLKLDIAVVQPATAEPALVGPVRCKVLQWKPKNTYPYAVRGQGGFVRHRYEDSKNSPLHSLGAAASDIDFDQPREMTA